MKTNLDRYSEIDREMGVLESQIGPLSDFGRDEKNPRFINLMYNIEKLKQERKIIYDKLSNAEDDSKHLFELQSKLDCSDAWYDILNLVATLRQNQKTPEDIDRLGKYKDFLIAGIDSVKMIDEVLDLKDKQEKEIRHLKDELDLERSKKGKYTKFGGGHRANSCEFEVHGSKCEHGDCDCPCHDEIEQLSERVNGLLSLIKIHENEKKQLEEENKRLSRFRTEHGIHELEVELQSLKNKIKHHVEVRAGETVFTVWRRELLEMIK